MLLIKRQILAIRATGLTNMFDMARVGELAEEMGFQELAGFLKTNKKEYSNFIFTGEFK